jgi:hypothetical protein
MDTSTAIIGTLILALFLLPVFIIARSGRRKMTRFEREFFSEASRNELNISEKDVYNEIAIGIDTSRNTILLLNWSGPERTTSVFNLKDVGVFESNPGYAEFKKPGFNFKKVEKLGFKFQFTDSIRPEINIVFYTAGFGQLRDAEVRLFSKWVEIIRKKMSSKSVHDLKHSA